MKKIVIAIDGFSSCGKSTMAKDLAKEIGYTYVDTGAMYRAVTLYSIRCGFFSGNKLDEEKLKASMPDILITQRFNPELGSSETYLNDISVEKEIRSMEVAGKVSFVAALPFVRCAMVAQQKKMGDDKGIVMDGRDVGTVIFPDAELKIFVTASPEIRAQRRLNELHAKGEQLTFEDVLANVNERDKIDTTRLEGPLRQAEDALVLDNSYLTIPEQKDWLLKQYQSTVERCTNNI